MIFFNHRKRHRKKNKRRNGHAGRSVWRKLIPLLLFSCLYLYCFSSLSQADLVNISQGNIRVQELAEKLLPADKVRIPEAVWTIYREVRNNGIEAVPEQIFRTLQRRSISNEPPISLDEIPPYTGDAYVSINGSVPTFTAEELNDFSCNDFAPLDALGRCGRTQVMLSPSTMPSDARGEIGMVKPSGWHTVKYQGVDGHYLYNRCHLIGFQLSGENANEKNLITGTRYLNIVGMLPFENAVAEYIRSTGNHVLYRVTPVFEGNNLLASGVVMEGQSIEDDGYGIYFNVYCYNVQPGITIDYANGDSSGPIYG